MKMDTSTWGLVIAVIAAALVLSSDYVHSNVPLFVGLVVGWLGITMIIRGRQENKDD